VNKLVIIIPIIVALFSFVGGAVALDDRYLKVQDYMMIEKSKRVRVLNDKVFEIEFKEQSSIASNLEKAMKKRYIHELQQLKSMQ